MKRVQLVHWHAGEAEERIEKLEAAGYRVEFSGVDGGEVARSLKGEPPDAVVIDLSRLPAHGRHLVLWMRERKSTRYLPVVFVGGTPERVAAAKRDYPDAVYATWSRIRSALKKAIAHPPKDPVVVARPDYSGTPLPKKLGVKNDSVLALLGAPKGIVATLGALPEGVRIKTQARGRCDVILLFCRSLVDLRRRFSAAQRAMAEGAGLWVAWPKQTSDLAADLTQPLVRAFGLDAGLVDNKVCAIDATWSGLRFARRRPR